MSKVPLVVWSGGADSTANVIWYFSNHIPFETVYIKLPNNEEQQKRELKARKKILKKLIKIYGNFHLKDTIINFVGVLRPPEGTALTQPYIWATSLAFNVDLSKYEKIVFGYIRGDDFWHIRPDFETIMTASQRMLLRGPPPVFDYPLEWATKEKIVDEYYRFDEDVEPLLNLVQVCEGNGTKPCGLCKKCLELSSATAKKTTEEEQCTIETT